MSPSPLQLERHFFTRIHLDAHRDGTPAATAEFRSEVDIARAAQDPNRFQLTLRLKLLASGDKTPHYTAEVDVVGFFHVAAGWPDAKALPLVQANGPALLYGAAREMLCNLTARGPWPMINLQSVSFILPPSPVSPTGPARH